MKLDKTILVMDWLDAYAGSEQVVKYLHQVYKFDKLYVLTNIMPSEKIKKNFFLKKPEKIEKKTKNRRFRPENRQINYFFRNFSSKKFFFKFFFFKFGPV